MKTGREANRKILKIQKKNHPAAPWAIGAVGGCTAFRSPNSVAANTLAN